MSMPSDIATFLEGQKKTLENTLQLIERLEGLSRILYEALQSVEWEDDDFACPRCHLCGGRQDIGHSPDCRVGNALKMMRE